MGKLAFAHWMIPTMIPNIPMADPNISTMSILTKVSGEWASAMAQPDPVIPTQIPQNRLQNPTERPVVNIAYPANWA